MADLTLNPGQTCPFTVTQSDGGVLQTVTAASQAEGAVTVTLDPQAEGATSVIGTLTCIAADSDYVQVDFNEGALAASVTVEAVAPVTLDVTLGTPS